MTGRLICCKLSLLVLHLENPETEVDVLAGRRLHYPVAVLLVAVVAVAEARVRVDVLLRGGCRQVTTANLNWTKMNRRRLI